MSLGLGEASALASALAWAIAAVFLMWGSDEVGIWTLNAYRCAWGCGVQLAIAGFTVDFTDLAHIEPFTWLAMFVSAVLGLGLGDGAHFLSIRLIGVARTLPLTTLYPLSTFFVGLVLLREALTAWTFAGTLLVTGGVVLIAVARGGRGLELTRWRLLGGLAASSVAALCWTASSAIMSYGFGDAPVPAVAMIRLAFMTLVLFGVLAIRDGGRGMRIASRTGFWATAVVGVLGTGLGGLLLLAGLKYAGAAKTAILVSTTPLFAMPIAVIFLNERLTWPLVAATLGTVAGVVLIVN